MKKTILAVLFCTCMTVQANACVPYYTVLDFIEAVYTAHPNWPIFKAMEKAIEIYADYVSYVSYMKKDKGEKGEIVGGNDPIPFSFLKLDNKKGEVVGGNDPIPFSLMDDDFDE